MIWVRRQGWKLTGELCKQPWEWWELCMQSHVANNGVSNIDKFENPCAIQYHDHEDQNTEL